ncbi:GroES-like protein [Earliella scabrosa]|nr:GroES-like protein [Earliella scabrosa]
MQVPNDIPATMKALVIEERHRAAVKEYPVPQIGDDDILIKTVAVSLNPTDWKHVDYPIGKVGTVVGCDLSGIVAKVGKNVTSPKIGEHVAGFVHGSAFEDEGAFAEYVKTPADLVWIVPPNTFAHEQAAALGVALCTAAQALYHPMRLDIAEPPSTVSANEWFFVYGGSSAVGLCTVQLARLSGFKVVATASPHNFSLVKDYGATEVINYKDAGVVQKVKEVTGDTIKNALDAISERETQPITVDSIAPSGGKVVVLLRPATDVIARKDVEVIHTLLYTALGRAFDFGPDTQYPASLEDKAQIVQFLKKLPQLVLEGAVKPLPVKLWEGGLEAIPDGLQYMREGKVSAEKIVYRLQ